MDAPVALIALAALAAGALLLRDPRRRAASLLAALLLDIAVVVAEAGGSDQLQPLRDDAALGLGVAAGVVAAVAGFAWLFARRPGALPIAAALALPFRLPVDAAGSVESVLVAVHVVVAAGVLAYAVPRLRAGDALPPSDDGWTDAADASPRRGAVAWLLALSILLYAVQSTASDDVHRATQVVGNLLIPGALLFVVLSRIAWTPRLARRTLIALVGVAVLLAGAAVAERATRHVLVLPDVVAGAQSGSALRIGSAFFDPELFGRFLVVTMVGLAAALLWARRARVAVVGVAALALLWAGVVVTLSDASLVGLLVGLLVLVGARWRPRWAIAAGAAGLAVVAALAALAPGTLHVDADRCAAARDGAPAGRCGLARAGAELLEERPVRGFGAGAFLPTYRRDRAVSAEQARIAARSAPVVVAVEQGVPGLVVLAGLLAAALVTLLRRLDGDPVRAAVGAAFAAVAVHALLGGPLLDDPLAWGLLGVGVALDRTAARHRRRRRKRRRAAPAPAAAPRPAVPA